MYNVQSTQLVEKNFILLSELRIEPTFVHIAHSISITFACHAKAITQNWVSAIHSYVVRKLHAVRSQTTNFNHLFAPPIKKKNIKKPIEFACNPKEHLPAPTESSCSSRACELNNSCILFLQGLTLRRQVI